MSEPGWAGYTLDKRPTPRRARTVALGVPTRATYDAVSDALSTVTGCRSLSPSLWLRRRPGDMTVPASTPREHLGPAWSASASFVVRRKLLTRARTLPLRQGRGSSCARLLCELFRTLTQRATIRHILWLGLAMSSRYAYVRLPSAPSVSWMYILAHPRRTLDHCQ